MDEGAGAERLACAIADRLSAALPNGLEPRAERDTVVLYAGDARNMVIPVRAFGDSGEAVEAVVDVLLAARDEAEGHTRTRYETAAAVDGDVVRLWFGRLEPATSEPPWRSVLPELPSLPLPLLLEDAGTTTATVPAVVILDADPYARGMAGVETTQPLKSVTLVGKRTRGYRVDLYRDESGIGLDRRGRRRVLRLGSLRLEWYPK
jgi:hypothetical protein